MEHRHKDLIIKWANNKDIKIEATRGSSGKWYEVPNPEWDEEQEYREVDPLKEFKDARAEGKTVQCKLQCGQYWLDTDPDFSLDTYKKDYYGVQFRIKPELEYIPFDWEDRDLLRGRWVKYIDPNSKLEGIIDSVQDTGITVSGKFYEFADFLRVYLFLDDSKCGKLKA